MDYLSKEFETYKRLLPSLLPQVGKFALIKEDLLVDTYDTYHDAMRQGYDRFQLSPFLVKQIAPAEHIAYFSRDFSARPA